MTDSVEVCCEEMRAQLNWSALIMPRPSSVRMLRLADSDRRVRMACPSTTADPPSWRFASVRGVAPGHLKPPQAIPKHEDA
jgi:hypothetical protein